MNSLRLKVVALASMMVFSTSNALAFDWSDLWQRPDQRAYQLLEEGDSATAAETFDDPQWRGVSHYRAGEFEQAQKEFDRLQDDTALYNQGVTAVQQGDFAAAVEKFESLVERSPDHVDGQHNLDIARELARQQEQQQQDGDQNQQQDGDEQQSEDGEQQQDQSGSEGESQQAENESEQGDSENDSEERGGDLAADAEDAASDQQQSESDDESQQAGQNAEQQEQEQAQQQQGGASEQQEGDPDQESQAAAMTQAGPSESEQATEQWLRRIPDDPSQLLRNKIKLNHMIEHSDVRDMQEPW